MKKILFVILILSCFSLTIYAKADMRESPSAKPILYLSKLSKSTSNGTSVIITDSVSTTINITQKLSFFGTTSPDAKVTITIKSSPITKEVSADENGSWTYTLDPKELKLSVGVHTVSAYSTDSNGLKSDEVQLSEFTLKKISKQIEETEDEDLSSYIAIDFSMISNYLLAGALIVLLGVFLMLKRKPTA